MKLKVEYIKDVSAGLWKTKRVKREGILIGVSSSCYSDFLWLLEDGKIDNYRMSQIKIIKVTEVK